MALVGRVMVALLLAGVLQSAIAVQYTVGGNGGWTLQSTAGVYDSQFANINLFPGDTLLFTYTAPIHNVFEVPPADIGSCDFSKPIKAYTQSNAVVTLNSSGVHAFGCQVPTHCSAGFMVLTVTVLAGAPTAAPAVAPVAAPVTAPTPGPVPTTRAPAPAPRAKSPAPAPGSPSPSVVSPSPTTGIPSGESPAPAPADEGNNAGNVVTSRPAIIMAAMFAGFAYLLL